MALTQDTITGFIGGVSQQPDKLMFPNQVKKMVNMSPDPVQGLCKRKPTEHIAKLMNPLTKHPYVHTIIKENEKYKVYLTGDSIRVFDLNGVEKTVNVAEGTSISYITTNDPLRDLTATTIADYTFITNKTINTALKNDLYPNPYPNAALIFVKQGDYGIDYVVKVNGTQVASKTTSDSSIADHKTNTIAQALYDGMVSQLGTTNWYISKLNSTIMLRRKDGAAFEVQTTDSNADRSLFSFYKETKSITDLPVVAPNGFLLKIIGEKGDTSDDYYVQFSTADGSSFGTGAWKECCSPDVKYKVDALTMPHALVREANGTFTFKTVDWTDRKAGDETTAKTPSIFGNPIEEVFTYKGRLGFIAGDRSLYSDVDDIFSLFKRTVMTSLDTDPIDVGSNSKMVLLKHSLAFNEDLLLFSPTSIFNITSGDVFSNSTVGIDLTMEYPCSTICKPICIGGTALFAHDNGIYSGLYEIYVASTYTKAARSITEQVPCYLPSGLYKMTANVENNIVCLLNKNIRNKIYVYNYYYTSEQKAQSAWHEWQFNGDILGAEFVDNYLYLSIQYEDGVYLERMDITPVQYEDDMDYLFYVDRKVYFNDELAHSQGRTIIYLPYPLQEDVPLTVLDNRGIPLIFNYVGGQWNRLDITGEYDAVIVGNTFESSFQLGNIYQRQATDTGVKVVEGLLMLKDVTLNYLNTGYFKVITTPHYTTMQTAELDTGTLRMIDETYGESSSFEFTGVILATVSATLGKISVSDGSFLFPVMAKNEDMDIEVVNDSYLPSTFTSLVWIGDFNVRGKNN